MGGTRGTVRNQTQGQELLPLLATGSRAGARIAPRVPPDRGDGQQRLHRIHVRVPTVRVDGPSMGWWTAASEVQRQRRHPSARNGTPRHPTVLDLPAVLHGDASVGMAALWSSPLLLLTVHRLLLSLDRLFGRPRAVHAVSWPHVESVEG